MTTIRNIKINLYNFLSVAFRGANRFKVFSLLSLSFRVFFGFVSPFFLPTCYTPWSVFQDGMIKVYINSNSTFQVSRNEQIEYDSCGGTCNSDPPKQELNTFYQHSLLIGWFFLRCVKNIVTGGSKQIVGR